MLVALVAVLAACQDAGSESGASGDTAPTVAEVFVVALDNSFQPGEVEIHVGAEVRWQNRGRNDHNVLPADESQKWGAPTAEFGPSDDYSVTFDSPGTYRYYCSIHGTKEVGMVGTVVVLPAEG